MMSENEIESIESIFSLSSTKRWQLYNYWRQQFIQNVEQKIKQKEEKYEKLSLAYCELELLRDTEILQESQIIGMTTTAAARYGGILNEIQPKIVIVEEAGEVLESHIVSSLSRGTEHLILIGDHKQLKPSTAVYELAKQYRLDISLFERLINCKFPFVTLTNQHRMRPQIASLMKHIYPNLQNHPRVEEYENIKGIASNLYFISHQYPENVNKESKSYSNIYEAKFIANLCQHLLWNNYQPSQITILTLYSGQLIQLKKCLTNNKLFADVRVCVVDNFQGEENEIILLSLVRSNEEEKMGFLNIDNRICVALSRARNGLYVIGNFQMLMKCKNELWKKMINEMMEINCCSDQLPISCQIHSNQQNFVKLPEDFLQCAPAGGCREICNELLSCGHVCVRHCHPMDRMHVNLYKCQQLCPKKCSSMNLHDCVGLCGQYCPPCQVEVHVKSLPFCRHGDLQIKCHQSTDLWSIKCSKPCRENLVCGHECTGTCGTCAAGRLHCKCVQKCKLVLICGHACEAMCGEICPPCRQVTCTGGGGGTCQHGTDPFKLCTKPCDWNCVHYLCRRQCHEECIRPVCDKACGKKILCNLCKNSALCIGLCGEPCPPNCRQCEISTKNTPTNSCFVYLKSCGHVIQVNEMDNWVKQYKTSAPDELIQTIVCPQCKAPVNQISTNRYKNLVLRSRQDFLLQYFLDSLDPRLDNKASSSSSYKEQWRKFQEKFKPFFVVPNFNCWNSVLLYKNSLFTNVNNNYVRPALLEQMTNAFDKTLLCTSPPPNTCGEIERCFQKYVQASYFWLVLWVLNEERSFSLDELNAFYCEMHRIDILVACLLQMNSNLLKQKWTETIIERLCYSEDLNEEIKQDWFQKFFQGIIPQKKERKVIQGIPRLIKGMWFRCDKGHLYCLENGNKQNSCPKCENKEPITFSMRSSAAYRYNKRYVL